MEITKAPKVLLGYWFAWLASFCQPKILQLLATSQFLWSLDISTKENAGRKRSVLYFGLLPHWTHKATSSPRQRFNDLENKTKNFLLEWRLTETTNSFSRALRPIWISKFQSFRCGKYILWTNIRNQLLLRDVGGGLLHAKWRTGGSSRRGSQPTSLDLSFNGTLALEFQVPK